MALIECKNCGHMISDKAKVCPHCQKGLNTASASIVAPASSTVNTTMGDYQTATNSKKSSYGWLLATLISLFIIFAFCCVGGYYYYQTIYLPEKIDREALRTYPIVNVQLRSTKMADADFNKITTIPFGGELITYETDRDWSKVKYVSPNPNDKPLEGYVATSYLLNKQDFYIVNSIFGDSDSREVLETAKVRRALLDFYKSNGITGRMTEETANDIGLTFNSNSQWQVKLRHGKTKPNEVLFKRVYNPDSKYTDMCLLIENIVSGERKVLFVTFDDDETHHTRMVADAPADYDIKDMVLSHGWGMPFDTKMAASYGGCLKIVYSNGRIAYYSITK